MKEYKYKYIYEIYKHKYIYERKYPCVIQYGALKTCTVKFFKETKEINNNNNSNNKNLSQMFVFMRTF